MLTYHRLKYGRYRSEPVPYRLNEIFTQPLTPDLYLVTTRQRAWILLSRAEYMALVKQEIENDQELFDLLEDLGIILTERNLADAATMHAHRYSYLHRAPGLFILVPTNRCNMACLYCHAEAGNAADHSLDMTEAIAFQAVDFFLTVPSVHERKCLTIEFQGGECLLRWDLVRATMDYANARCAELGYETSYALATNLLGMTDAIAREIAERKNVRISSSLDGPKEVNDRQRITHNGQGTYDLHKEWADRLRDDYGQKFGFLPTLTRNNIGHERELVEEYLRRQIPSIYLRYVNQVGRAYTDSYDALGLTPEEYLGIWSACLEEIFAVNESGQKFSDRKSAELMGNLLTPSYSYMCLRRPCGIGIHEVVVDQHGDIYGCDMARSNPMYRLGNVTTDTYDETFLAESARLMRTLVSELYPKCRTCALSPYCGYCVARGTRQHGSPLPKMPEDFECQIYIRMIPALLRQLTDQRRAAILNRWA